MKSHALTIARSLMAALLATVLGAGMALAAGSTTSTDATAALEPVRVKIKDKDWTSAIVDLRQIADRTPHADVYSLLGYAQRNAGDTASSLASYTKALALDPNHKGANEYLGELYIKTGETEKAKAQLVVLRRLCPQGCEERKDLEKDLAEAGIKVE